MPCCWTSAGSCSATAVSWCAAACWRGVPGSEAYVQRVDFAGPGDELWQAMLRDEVTERAYWAQRAAEIGTVLGHEGWRTLDLITLLYDSRSRSTSTRSSSS